MNRLQEWAKPSAASPEIHPHTTSKVETRPGAAPYALFLPLHYEKNYAYPLIVWLHGPDDNENQLRRVIPLVSTRNYVAVAPRGTCLQAAARPAQPACAWRQSGGEIVLAQQRVFECIALAQRRAHVDPRRVFLAGYACGGTMALRIALSRPEAFAGAISIGGPFPTGRKPLAHLLAARRLPLLLSHGRHSTAYSIEEACENLRLFHAAGLCVTLRQYPCGDEVTTQMLSDMDEWIMQQVTGVESEPAPQCCLPPNEWN